MNLKKKKRHEIRFLKATALRKEPVRSESAMTDRNMINSEINFGFENKDFQKLNCIH